MGTARGFGFVFATVFTLIGLWPLIAGHGVWVWALCIAAVFATLALLKPDILQPLNKLWFRFGMLLGLLITPLIMGILFFGIFMPMALLLKLLRKDLLNLKLAPGSDSYWVRRDREERQMQSMKNQF